MHEDCEFRPTLKGLSCSLLAAAHTMALLLLSDFNWFWYLKSHSKYLSIKPDISACDSY